MNRDRAQRPTPRWCHAAVELGDLAIVTWEADPDRLGALLPAGFEPDVRHGPALVSTAAFLDRGFHFRGAPFVRMSCGQVDHRAHVRFGDEWGVWFVGSTLDSRLAGIPRALWRMPWHRATIEVDATWSDSRRDVRLEAWRLRAVGTWGSAAITLAGTGDSATVPRFAGRGADGRSLFDPFVGWYSRSDGSGIGRCTVWHEPVDMVEATVESARCDVFSDLGLIGLDQPPASAGVQRSIHFDVHTPPTRHPHA